MTGWTHTFKAKLGAAIVQDANGAHIATVHVLKKAPLIASAQALLDALRDIAEGEETYTAAGMARIAREAVAQAEAA
jgi:uncharacterized membrane protein